MKLENSATRIAWWLELPRGVQTVEQVNAAGESRMKRKNRMKLTENWKRWEEDSLPDERCDKTPLLGPTGVLEE